MMMHKDLEFSQKELATAVARADLLLTACENEGLEEKAAGQLIAVALCSISATREAAHGLIDYLYDLVEVETGKKPKH